MTSKLSEWEIYSFTIKEKTGRLITDIALKENIPLSNKKRFRIDWDAFRERQLYSYCFLKHKKKDGTKYDESKSIFYYDLNWWMEDNFPDLMCSIQMYEKFRLGTITQDDLKKLNKIYKKYR